MEVFRPDFRGAACLCRGTYSQTVGSDAEWEERGSKQSERASGAGAADSVQPQKASSTWIELQGLSRKSGAGQMDDLSRDW